MMNVGAATWVGICVGLIILLFVAPLLARYVARVGDDPKLFRTTMWGAGIKLAAFVRSG